MNMQVYRVTFRHPGPAAGQISVVGSFNHWNPATHPLAYEDGEWRVTLFLPSGTYPYAFVVDDLLTSDPDPMRALRGPLGSRYSVIVVPGEPQPLRAA